MSNTSWFDIPGLGPGDQRGLVSSFEPGWQPERLPQTAPETVPAGAPPLLYLPCVRPVADGVVAVRTRVMRDGRVALLAYTALDRLTAFCGATQPWVVAVTAHLDKLDRVTPFDVVLLDLPVPYHARTNGRGPR
ncbi:SAV_915 family protein [Amycolatopsis sp. PS_44_ISF1]|uniref:SAV_915 family protein n=1 Tax=Amycolatopsis sp. PS_44_ISF1 TaxID=2974917 RepID=UPI0028DE791C|nr:SAV_915 family protein [Amycolatopsis sp. PS_44_ISF1]MDT8913597.1 hypothetical protein [Amycolatopsis sp. PS_44_ISF1]